MLEILLIGITVFHKNKDHPRLSNIEAKLPRDIYQLLQHRYACSRHFQGEEMEAH